MAIIRELQEEIDRAIRKVLERHGELTGSELEASSCALQGIDTAIEEAHRLEMRLE